MEIGNEISQKVRLAIKAKLVDLGAYVDDELPDYIMVMVANKKSREQMTDDLNLFLGNNTEKFTAWLCALLEKLQSIANKDEPLLDKQSVSEPKPQPEVKTQESAEVRRSENTQVRKSESTDRKKTSEDSSSAKKADGMVSDASRKRTSSDSHESSTISPQDKVKKSRLSDSSEQRKSEETQIVPDIILAAEKDALFEAEVEASDKRPVSGGRQMHRQSSSGIGKSVKVAASPVRGGKDVATKETSTSNSSAPVSSRSSREQEPSRSGAHTDASRQRRPLTSAIGAVVSRQSQEEEEEPYDPYKPAIGKVASQVKITERKSKVPSTWQADKSILLKAVSAAQDSIEKSGKRKEKAIVKPVSHDIPSRRARSSVHHRLHTRRARSPLHRSGMRSARSSGSSSLRRSRSPRDRGRPVVRRSPSPISAQRSGRDSRQHGTGSSSISTERKIQVFSRSRDEEVFSRITSKVKETTAQKEEEKVEGKETVKIEEKSQESSDDKKEKMYEDDILELSVPEDNRLIEYELEDPSGHVAPPYKATPISRTVGTLIESGAEESDFTDGEGEDSRFVRQRVRQHERSPSPKFVVTLDGVDPTLLKTDVKFVVEEEEILEVGEVESEIASQEEEVGSPMFPGSKQPPRNIVRVEPRPQQPSIQPVTIVNLQDDEDVDGDGDSIMMEEGVVQKPSSAEKCHFWPACKNGEACPYFHPTEPCRNFPRCKFGEKCLYIHPSCKFDAQCSKPNCPFAHTVRKPAPSFTPALPVIVQPIKVPMYAGGFYPPTRPPRHPAPKPPGQVTCRFFPQCTNMNCHFFHPKPCRFGISCNTKATCQFSHPKLPTKDKLTWSTKTPTKKDIGPLVSPGVSPILPSAEPTSSTPKS